MRPSLDSQKESPPFLTLFLPTGSYDSDMRAAHLSFPVQI